jgi:glutamine amidotransferase
MTTLAVIDYGMGNRRSVEKALEHVGARTLVTGDPATLEQADALVVPGVGAFPQGMRNLTERGLDDRIRSIAAAGTPVLGICLGMQLLFERSQEHELTDGLGLLAGEVSPLQASELRIPHIGWNDVRFERPSPLTAGLPGAGCAFYHVHSLAARPEDPADVIATTEYGERFATIVGHGNVFGVQFHPEKSSRDGLALLSNFVALASGNGGSRGRAWAGATSR